MPTETKRSRFADIRRRRRAEGLCTRCGQKVETPGRATCAGCVAAALRRRDAKLAQAALDGVCPYCGQPVTFRTVDGGNLTGFCCSAHGPKLVHFSSSQCPGASKFTDFVDEVTCGRCRPIQPERRVRRKPRDV